MPVPTKDVVGRRSLAFNSLDDIIADAQMLVECPRVRTLGNWSLSQILTHVAIMMDVSIDGSYAKVPLGLKIQGFFLKWFIPGKPMQPGFQVPEEVEQDVSPSTTVELADAFDHLKRAVHRLRNQEERSAHPIFGRFSIDKWNQLHCRHAELHFSFAIPQK